MTVLLSFRFVMLVLLRETKYGYEMVSDSRPNFVKNVQFVEKL
jgi:hypothetical protein